MFYVKQNNKHASQHFHPNLDLLEYVCNTVNVLYMYEVKCYEVDFNTVWGEKKLFTLVKGSSPNVC